MTATVDVLAQGVQGCRYLSSSGIRAAKCRADGSRTPAADAVSLMKQEVPSAMRWRRPGAITGSPASACRRAGQARPTWSTASRTPSSTARR